MDDKPKFHMVSFSGGKDSTAMLLHMIELGMQIDCIQFCDTGLDFPDLLAHIDRVEKDIGRKITRLKSPKSFEYYMFEHVKKNGTVGYSWAGSRSRWCTTALKTQQREKFLSPIRKQFDVIEYIGIAADETKRLERKNNQREDARLPLVEWGWSEADCLAYCKSKGYDWNGLYDYFDRVSCWCCPLQSLKDLRQLYHHFPDLWKTLKEWDSRTWRQFRADYSVDDLEKRFAFEDECIAKDKPICGKEFFVELREKIKGEKHE